MDVQLEQYEGPLLDLAQAIGRAPGELTLPREGNLAAPSSDGLTFWMQEDGTSLVNLAARDLTLCRFDTLNALFENPNSGDGEVARQLGLSRLDGRDAPLSPDALLHAILLQLSGVEVSLHLHPVHLCQIACSPQVRAFATNHLIPEQYTRCGPAMLLIPPIERPMQLAMRLRHEVDFFQKRYGDAPKVILLESHGVLITGGSAREAMDTLMMAEKCARIFVGAHALGGPVFLQREQVEYLRKANGDEDSKPGPPVTGSPVPPARTPPASEPRPGV